MVGRTLAGRYRIEEELVGGERLSVYLAADTATGREVEVDVVAARTPECPVPAKRLEEILDAAARLRGRHISAVHGWGEEGEEGLIYVVRERISGASLAEVLAGTGNLPRPQVVEITRAAVEVLAEAYGKGLYYLGLNPHQVWIDGRGGVRFSRVGFSWVLEEMESAMSARVSPYRAPETDGSREGSRTSDVYALALMVREMLPPEDLCGRLSSLLEMATDPLPRRRPSSPRLLLEELEEVAGKEGEEERRGAAPQPHTGGERKRAVGNGGGFPEGDTPTLYISPPGRPRRRVLRNLLLIIAGGLVLWLVIAAAAGILGGRGSRPGEVPGPVEETVTLPDLQGLTAEEAEELVIGLGLACASRQAPSRLWSAGRVVAQEPGCGAVLRPGDTVCLVVSSGREEVEAGGEPQGQEKARSAPDVPAPVPAPAVGMVPDPPRALSSGGAGQTSNKPPRAAVSLSPRSGPAPLCVAMDASASCDPEGAVVRYLWDCGDGTLLEGKVVQHVYDPAVIPARFRVVLQVFDAEGLSHSSSAAVEVY